jgi:hypothetical protein
MSWRDMTFEPRAAVLLNAPYRVASGAGAPDNGVATLYDRGCIAVRPTCDR